LSAPIATVSVYLKIMSAIAVDTRSANGNHYHSLRAEFEAAYKEMLNASREFNSVLMNVPDGLSPEEQRARNDRAAQVYEDARVRFMAAVANLNQFRIGQMVSSRSAIQLVAAHR
jgi:hypothetical protein